MGSYNPYCQSQPQSRPSWAVAGFNSSFSVRQAGWPADPIQNSTFWSESDFTVKSKVVSLDGWTLEISSDLNPIGQGGYLTLFEQIKHLCVYFLSLVCH